MNDVDIIVIDIAAGIQQGGIFRGRDIYRKTRSRRRYSSSAGIVFAAGRQ